MPRFFQHQPHPAVSIGTKAVLSLLCDDLCKNRVFLRFAQTMYEIIASASGPLKEPAHNGYRIFVSVPVDHCVFCPWPHFLPMERRKNPAITHFPSSAACSHTCTRQYFCRFTPSCLGKDWFLQPAAHPLLGQNCCIVNAYDIHADRSLKFQVKKSRENCAFMVQQM